ncbi:MAG: hypothetical protein H0V25_10615 [Solirubrobacterales bacterium]|nr:hypothetical protein [Solirubrobacterales bacterium]
MTADGTMSTIAGGPREGFAGDGGPAVAATLGAIGSIDVAPDGSILLADGARIRRIDGGGTITTVAGTGRSGYNGDSIPATSADLSGNLSVDATDGGGFLIGDFGNGRVRKVSADGTITTLAGMPALSDCEKAPYNGIQGAGGDDVLPGAELRDLIRGEDGNDTLTGAGAADCIAGGLDNDNLSGGPQDDVIDAGNGDDRVRGDDGNDRLIGQDGADRMAGGGGRDVVFGGWGDDHISGGPGDDELYGYVGRDVLTAGAGNDYVDAQTGERESANGPKDIVRCGPGNDTARINTFDRAAKSCEHLRGAGA